MADAFAQLRDQTLALVRDPVQVQNQVQAMRERMRAELDRSSAQMFDLKQGRGGLVDIEFALQAAVLSASQHVGAGQHTQIQHWSSRTELLLPQLYADAEPLHRKLLALGLRATLELRPRIVPRDAIAL